MDSRFAKSLNILLVEDDDLDIQHVRRALKKANIINPVWVASDGDEALDMLRGEEYPTEGRLVLLDIDLPKRSGVEVLKEVRSDERLRGLNVVVMASSNEDRYRTEAHALDVAGYLLKPFTSHSFFDLMATINFGWHLVKPEPESEP